MANNTMTEREFLTLVQGYDLNEDLQHYITTRIETLDEQNTRAAERRAAKDAEAMEEVQDFMEVYVNDPEVIYSANGIAETINEFKEEDEKVTVQKVSALLRKAVRGGLLFDKENAGVGASGRKVKGYALNKELFQ